MGEDTKYCMSRENVIGRVKCEIEEAEKNIVDWTQQIESARAVIDCLSAMLGDFEATPESRAESMKRFQGQMESDVDARIIWLEAEMVKMRAAKDKFATDSPGTAG